VTAAPPARDAPDGASGSAAADTIAVAVAWATPGAQDVVCMLLPAGATVGDAVVRSALADPWGFDPGHVGFAVAGRRVRAATPLRDGDRIDVLRPLTVDPKDARRRRAEARPLPRPAPGAKGGSGRPDGGGPPDER
jgi:uncharacterized protein